MVINRAKFDVSTFSSFGGVKSTYVDKSVQKVSHFIYLICQIVLLMASFQQHQIMDKVLFKIYSKLTCFICCEFRFCAADMLFVDVSVICMYCFLGMEAWHETVCLIYMLAQSAIWLKKTAVYFEPIIITSRILAWIHD